jgi:hypothetical protein
MKYTKSFQIMIFNLYMHLQTVDKLNKKVPGVLTGDFINSILRF